MLHRNVLKSRNLMTSRSDSSSVVLTIQSDRLQDLLAIFPNPSCQGIALSQPPRWYLAWLEKQLSLLPRAIWEILPESVANVTKSDSLHSNAISSLPAVLPVFRAVANFARLNPGSTSIDRIIENLLISPNYLNLRDDEAPKDLESARSLVFAIMGWQTMLYTPSFGTAPPDQFALEDTLDGYNQGYAFLSLKQSHDNSKYNTKTFLKGFGLLLPAPNLCFQGCEEGEDFFHFDATSVVSPRDLNYGLLRQVCGVKITWVDNFAPHMEYDAATGTLFLFRWPSFCVMNIPLDMEKGEQRGNQAASVLQRLVFYRVREYSFGDATGTETNWISESDVPAYLQEILLSYRFLFGQDKRSRRVFREKERCRINSGCCIDAAGPLLDSLCGRKTFDNSNLFTEMDAYRLHRDFPFLRSRIITLKRELAKKKARSWKDLWKDKRDTGNWYTFWAVIFIGGIGLILAAAQTALAAAQLGVAQKE